MPNFEKPFKLYMDTSFEGLGAALHQEQMIDGRCCEVAICFVLKTTAGRGGLLWRKTTGMLMPGLGTREAALLP